MACFADINVSQGSVATYARCAGIFDIHLTANFPRNLPVKKFLNRLRIDRIMVMSLWPHFLAHPVYAYNMPIQLHYILLYRLVTRDDAHDVMLGLYITTPSSKSCSSVFCSPRLPLTTTTFSIFRTTTYFFINIFVL